MFEVATFRRDSKESDGRRPDYVEFATMEEDAYRRDFTINALFFDPITGTLHDFVNGEEDLKNNNLQFVNSPVTRIEEDYLRILRAVRFAVRFNMALDIPTMNALISHKKKVHEISAERVTQELIKMFELNKTRAVLETLQTLHLLEELFPEVYNLIGVPQNPEYHPEGDAFEHTLCVVENLDKENADPITILAGMLHDIGKKEMTKIEDGKIISHGHAHIGADMCEEICDRLKLSNKDKEKVIFLVAKHMTLMNATKMKKSRRKSLMAKEYFEDLLLLHKADKMSGNKNLEYFTFLTEKYEEFKEEGKLPPYILTGKDLILRGLEPGPLFKSLLNQVREAQLENEIVSKEDALKYVDNILSQKVEQ